MIYLKLYGGLGNQMFEYAAGRALALRHQTKLVLDTSSYQPDALREYELHHFAVTAEIATPEQVRVFHDERKWQGWVRAFRELVQPSAVQLFHEPGFSFSVVGLIPDNSGLVGRFASQLLQQPDNTYLAGFWQSERYFANYAKQIRSDFRFTSRPDNNNQNLLDQIKTTTSVSLHIRRTDYLTNPAVARDMVVIGLGYYKQAVAYIAGQVKNPTFYVISDDPAWCRKNLKLTHPTVFVDANPATRGFEDMRLMSSCQHHIIANSSFSWWGAWLGANSQKIVIAPKQWFTNPKLNTSDLIPDSWIKR